MKIRTKPALREFDDPIVFKTTLELANRGIIRVRWAKPPEIDI